MNYFDFELLDCKEIGTDQLHNPIYEKIGIGTYQGRFTPWTSDEVLVEGRELTSSSRKLLTRAPAEACAAAKFVRVNGVDYAITNYKSTPRWRILYVKGWRL